mgnify:CR=1 FL=1
MIHVRKPLAGAKNDAIWFSEKVKKNRRSADRNGPITERQHRELAKSRTKWIVENEKTQLHFLQNEAVAEIHICQKIAQDTRGENNREK